MTRQNRQHNRVVNTRLYLSHYVVKQALLHAISQRQTKRFSRAHTNRWIKRGIGHHLAQTSRVKPQPRGCQLGGDRRAGFAKSFNCQRTHPAGFNHRFDRAGECLRAQCGVDFADSSFCGFRNVGDLDDGIRSGFVEALGVLLDNGFHVRHAQIVIDLRERFPRHHASGGLQVRTRVGFGFFA